MERALRKHLPGGAFTNVSATRSKAMAAVRGQGNKTTERRLRLALVRAGVRGWQVRPKGLRGNPDFVFPVARIVVFVDGCFWHGCPKCGHVPRTNRPYWAAKLKRNRERDLKTTDQLEAEGFHVLRFWEHELKDSLEACIATVEAAALSRSMQPGPKRNGKRGVG